MDTDTDARPVLRALSLLFYAASVLVLVAAWQLFVLTDHTDRFFAWTIGAPITAAVEGAFYLAAFFLLFPAARARAWAEVKPISFGVLAVSTLKLVATLLHVVLFHFTDGAATARFAAWGWLAVYVLVPIALGALIVALAVAADRPHRAGAVRLVRGRGHRRRRGGRGRRPRPRAERLDVGDDPGRPPGSRPAPLHRRRGLELARRVGLRRDLRGHGRGRRVGLDRRFGYATPSPVISARSVSPKMKNDATANTL